MTTRSIITDSDKLELQARLAQLRRDLRDPFGLSPAMLIQGNISGLANVLLFLNISTDAYGCERALRKKLGKPPTEEPDREDYW